MRSYLRRCESAINSINLSAKRLSSSSTPTPTTPNDNGISKPTTSSWYVDEFGSEITESTNESGCINSTTDTIAQRLEPLISNSDEQTTAVLNESANNCIPKLRQQQVMLSPVSKNEIH